MTTILALAALVSAGCAPAASSPPPAGEGSSSAALGRGPGPRLRWAPPKLRDPVTVSASSKNRKLELDDATDYIIRMPAAPLAASGGLVVVGGHNVVLIGGRIDIPWQGTEPPPHSRRGLFLKNQTGVVHVEGLRIGGSDLAEGINLDQRRGSVVQLQNVRVDRLRPRDEVRFSDTHADVLQSWGGPRVLRIDRFTGVSPYQGFFLVPQFHPIEQVDLRRVNLIGVNRGRYMLWRTSNLPFALRTQDVYVSTGRHRLRESLWPRRGSWPEVRPGRPSTGSYVKARDAGLLYRSPGYVTVER